MENGRFIFVTKCIIASVCGIAALHACADASSMFRRWTTVDGLPENIVTAMTQTPDGYLWLKTPLGVSRFDGVRFETYLSPNLPDIRFEPKHQLNAPEFPGYQVLCSLAESNGVTWGSVPMVTGCSACGLA